MNSYLTSITPDSISGILFALEGVSGSVVLLNGPMGCRSFHSSTSERQLIRPYEFDPLDYGMKWYFGQNRIPSTYLDSGDYIYGGREKLIEALKFINQNVRHNLVAIVNTPGAALIGDDLVGIARTVFGEKKVVTVETPGYSLDLCAGYETGVFALLDALNPPKLPVVKKTVNLLGLSIIQRYFKGDLMELERLLSLCGIEINCALCVGSTAEEINNISTAELNLVVRPEYGYSTGMRLNKQYETPYHICDSAPIGFAATEQFIREICHTLDCDPELAIDDINRARADAYIHVSHINAGYGLPKGVRVAVEGTYSEIYGYFKFLTEYLGMLPHSASVLCPDADIMKEKYEEQMQTYGLSDVINRDFFTDRKSELVFASGMTISQLKDTGMQFVGVENALPSLGYVDVIPKTHLGVKGSLQIVEQVLNALIF